MKTKSLRVNADVIYGRGGRIFVVSDIHGNAQDFFHWMNQVEFSDSDFCIVNGDVIDRGPDGIGLLLYVLNNPNNFLFLMGNHEELMLGALHELQHNQYNDTYYECWMHNGGKVTMDSYCHLNATNQTFILNALENAAYVAEITSKQHENILVAHAGLNKKWLSEVQSGILSKDKYGMSNVTWAREEWWNTPNDLGCLLVTGHTSSATYGAELGEVKWDEKQRRFVVDCNTIRTHKVGFVCFEPTTLHYSSY